MSKLGRLSTRGIVPVAYGNHFERQRTGWFGRRLVVAPASSPVALLEHLARESWRPPYRLLYVLVEPMSDREPGRYQFTTPLDGEELGRFLDRHRAFLETDGRHHLWLAPAHGRARLVYDRHDLIVVYGNVRRAERLLRARGFTPGSVAFPEVHVHGYPADAHGETTLLASPFWEHSPLQDIDRY